ncbi:unnamed protein product, partial [Didymodactylos carnosus]
RNAASAQFTAATATAKATSRTRNSNSDSDPRLSPRKRKLTVAEVSSEEEEVEEGGSDDDESLESDEEDSNESDDEQENEEVWILTKTELKEEKATPSASTLKRQRSLSRKPSETTLKRTNSVAAARVSSNDPTSTKKKVLSDVKSNQTAIFKDLGNLTKEKTIFAQAKEWTETKCEVVAIDCNSDMTLNELKMKLKAELKLHDEDVKKLYINETMKLIEDHDSATHSMKLSDFKIENHDIIYYFEPSEEFAGQVLYIKTLTGKRTTLPVSQLFNR